MICVGMMNMRPMDFWDLSPREMYLSYTKDFINLILPGKDQPMDSSRLEELMELNPD